MAQGQAQTKQLPDAVEPPVPVNRCGEPGIAGRRTSGAVPWESNHPVNLRLSIPLLPKRYYLTIVAGKERRGPERLAAERLNHPIRTKGNIVGLLVAGTVVGMALFTIVQLVGNWVLAQTGRVQL